MSTPESKGASPGPWRWRPEPHSSNVLIAADGDTIATYDEAYLQPRGPRDEVNRALIASAPEMASMLRSLEWFNDTGHGSTCPRCLAGISRGHATDCPLDALLTRVGR